MLREIFRNKDIRKKLLFTIFIITIFEIGVNIPVPGIDHSVLQEMFGNNAAFELFDLFTGGAFGNMTIFALGITPYITASIIFQLLTIAVPRLEALSQEGETGRKKIATYTRYLTVVLGLVQAAGMTFGIFRNAVKDSSALTDISIILLLTAGMTILMWLGEQINEYGIGNGISLIIFASIANRIPVDVKKIWSAYDQETISFMTVILIALFAAFIIGFVIYVNEGVRKIPVNYSKRVVGRKAYGGTATHLPIKVNAAGVIPIIFAMSILQFPIVISYIFSESGYARFVTKYLSTNSAPGAYIYMFLNFALILFFTYFYTAIVFKPKEISNNLAENSGLIPGIRPGKTTEQYLSKVSGRLCLASGTFLGLISSLPILTSVFSTLSLSFGGTSILIIVGVALDTMKQIDNKLTLNNHYGFLDSHSKNH